jgi:adenosylcobinamide kinase/adenosylcobinamide-phosphate guanylyltransferase
LKGIFMFGDHISSAFDAFSDLKSPVLIGGPAHAGKSNFVTEWLAGTANAVVIGTATLQDRTFTRHLETLQKARPVGWTIVDEPISLTTALEKSSRECGTIIVDSLNQWLSNILVESLKIHDPAQTIDALKLETSALLTTITKLRTGTRLVLVTSEVGACPAPARIEERIFRQCLGQLNAAVAKLVPTVVHIQYGLPCILKRSALQ